MRIAAVEVGQRHLVIVGDGVAQLRARLRHLGQGGLHAQDVLHLLLGGGLLEAEQAEHAYDVALVGLPNLGGGGVGLQVIVLLTERQPRLTDTEDVLRGILLVGTEVGAEELLITVAGLLQLYLEELLLGLGGLQLADDGHGRCDAVALAAVGVHGQLIEVAQFLLHAACGIAVVEQFLQDTVDALVVVFSQAVETAIARIGGRQGVGLHPAATGILIEVVGRPHTGVQVGHIQARLQLCRCYRGHHC